MSYTWLSTGSKKRAYGYHFKNVCFQWVTAYPYTRSEGHTGFNSICNNRLSLTRIPVRLEREAVGFFRGKKIEGVYLKAYGYTGIA